MGVRNTTYTETTKPAQALMNYEFDRFDAWDSLPKFGLILGSLLVAVLGATLVSILAPTSTWEWQEIGMARTAWLWFGALVFIVSGLVMANATALLIYGWWSNTYRRAASFKEDLRARQLNGGLEIEREVSEWEFDADIPLHLLALVVSVHRREMQRRERGSSQAAPWSVRNITGPLMIGGRRLLTVDEWEAREAGQILAQLGIVEGREEKTAGHYVPDTLEEAIDLFERNLRKIGPRE